MFEIAEGQVLTRARLDWIVIEAFTAIDRASLQFGRLQHRFSSANSIPGLHSQHLSAPCGACRQMGGGYIKQLIRKGVRSAVQHAKPVLNPCET